MAEFEICDYNIVNVTVCWSIDAGRTNIHFTSHLSELLRLREIVDKMIKGLQEIETKKNRNAKKMRGK